MAARTPRPSELIDRGLLQEMTRGEDPRLLADLETYISEADFGASMLVDDLGRQPEGARILEVGSGLGLLAISLAARGFHVTAVEPPDTEFASMQKMAKYVAQAAEGSDRVEWVAAFGEEYRGRAFDFAYSINVIEHVDSVWTVIRNASSSVKPRRHFRFVCPNYDFPYEPHFNTPTLIRKDLTERVMRPTIENCREIAEPVAMWDGLSWPSVRSLRASRPSDVALKFSRDATRSYVARLLDSPDFVERKGGVFKLLQRPASKLGSGWVDLCPMSLLPIIDCRAALVPR